MKSYVKVNNDLYSLKNGNRMERPAGCPTDVYNLMQKCM